MQASIFGGTLVRDDAGWTWSDGTPEPRVTDLTASEHFNFRCRQVRGETYVEVLLSAAHADRQMLGWVLSGVEDRTFQQAISGDHTGPMVISEDEDGEPELKPMRIEPGEDPLKGNEPIISKRAIPKVALVPVAVWDRWAKTHPYGATWDTDQQEDIFAIARRLGWSG